MRNEGKLTLCHTHLGGRKPVETSRALQHRSIHHLSHAIRSPGSHLSIVRSSSNSPPKLSASLERLSTTYAIISTTTHKCVMFHCSSATSTVCRLYVLAILLCIMRRRRKCNGGRSRLLVGWWLAVTLLACTHIQLCAPFAPVKCSLKLVAVQHAGNCSSAAGCSTGVRSRRGRYSAACRRRVPWPLFAAAKEGDADVAYGEEMQELRKTKSLERKIKQVGCAVVYELLAHARVRVHHGAQVSSLGSLVAELLLCCAVLWRVQWAVGDSSSRFRYCFV